MNGFVFVRDTVMSPETFEALPELPAPHTIESVHPGTLCRAFFEGDGHAGGWHAVAVLHMNGTHRAVASRIHVRNYQPED